MTARLGASVLRGAVSARRPRATILVSGTALFFATLVAAHAAPMGRDEARLLLVRTSFAASEAEVDRFASLTREEAVDGLLAWVHPATETAPPEWVNVYDHPTRDALATREGRESYRKQQQQRTAELRAWWVSEMMSTSSPVTEKMTLFWHNHFTSSQQKVGDAHFVYAQNALFRRYAFGNFRTLLHAVARDPAMLIYLDSAGSRSEAPNENFAREVMELFTLGEGQYTERDIKEAARAVTGWTVDRERGIAVFRPRFHDFGVKTIMGTIGRFDMDQMLDVLLAQPEASRFVVGQLWKEFVSPTPDAAEVERLARVFRDADYELTPVLRALFMSDAFYAEVNRGSLVKSPVDLVIGTLRAFRFQVNEPGPFVNALRQLGQDLFNPPNVKGWPGGEAWIHSASLLGRKQLLERLFRFEERDRPDARRSMNGAIEFDDAQWLAPFTRSSDGAIRMRHALLAVAPVNADDARPALAGIRQLVLDPAYQLK